MKNLFAALILLITFAPSTFGFTTNPSEVENKILVDSKKSVAPLTPIEEKKSHSDVNDESLPGSLSEYEVESNIVNTPR